MPRTRARDAICRSRATVLRLCGDGVSATDHREPGDGAGQGVVTGLPQNAPATVIIGSPWDKDTSSGPKYYKGHPLSTSSFSKAMSFGVAPLALTATLPRTVLLSMCSQVGPA